MENRASELNLSLFHESGARSDKGNCAPACQGRFMDGSELEPDGPALMEGGLIEPMVSREKRREKEIQHA